MVDVMGERKGVALIGYGASIRYILFSLHMIKSSKNIQISHFNLFVTVFFCLRICNHYSLFLLCRGLRLFNLTRKTDQSIICRNDLSIFQNSAHVNFEVVAAS